MAKPHYSPKFQVLKEEQGHGLLEEEPSPPRGCFPCFGSTRESRARPATSSWAPPKRPSSLREAAAARHEWKSLVWKVGGYLSKKRKTKSEFRYDSSNYALNFDDGSPLSDEEEERERFGHGFTLRFAPPVHEDGVFINVVS